MTNTLFLILLSVFATLSGLVTEAIKKLIGNKTKISSNVLALCVSVVVGGAGTAIFYQLNAITFTVNNIIYLFLMGFASALTSMVGYDKVSQLISQITTQK